MVDILIFTATVLMVLLIMAAISFVASYCEYKGWNGGVCPVCGKPLRHFDTDSQGGEGWTCDKCDHTVWVANSSTKS